MKTLDELRRRIGNLLTAPLTELGSWARFARSQITLWRFCVRRLHENNVMAMSSALSFRTIFALVPTIIVAFLALKSLGVVEDSKHWLRDFLDRSGLTRITYMGSTDEPPPDAEPPSELPEPPDPDADMPGTPPYTVPQRITVAEKIEQLVEHVEGQLTVGRVAPLGVVLLVWSALTLLTTVERCLNRIFEASRARGLARRILLYWSVVTLGPLVIVVAVRAGGGLVESVRNLPVLSWTLGPVGWVAPFVVGILFLASLYTLMPNTRVPWRQALEGALLAVPLWGLARWGFAAYVERVGSQSLYGALGLLPLFLLWLNLSWWIFLFGAEVAHAAANVERLLWADQDGDRPTTPWHDLAVVLAVARTQVARSGPATPAEVAQVLGLAEYRAEAVLRRLADAGILIRSDDAAARCALAMPPDRLPVTRILNIQCADGDVPADGADEAVAQAVAEVRRRSEAGLDRLTVADLLASAPGDEEPEQP